MFITKTEAQFSALSMVDSMHKMLQTKPQEISFVWEQYRGYVALVLTSHKTAIFGLNSGGKIFLRSASPEEAQEFRRFFETTILNALGF